MNIQGTWTLVTGGAVRIGRAICLVLAGQGGNVIVHYRHSGVAAEALVAQLLERGVQASMVQGDLADAEACRRIMADAWALSGSELLFLVNNASAFGRDCLLDCSETVLMRQMRPNFVAPLLLLADFAARHRQRGSAAGPAKVVNLLDRKIDGNEQGCIPYLLSKKMLAELTRLAAAELSPFVMVNGVAPGAALPPVLVSGGDRQEAVFRPDCTPEEVAHAVLSLLQSDTITGEIVRVESREAWGDDTGAGVGRDGQRYSVPEPGGAHA